MKFTVPHTFVIILALAILMAALTYILPAGTYDRVYDETTGKELVVTGTYHLVEANPQGVTALLKAPIKGIVSAASIIAFVMIVGGAFGIISRTGAITAGIARFVSGIKGREVLIIPFSMIVFGLGGTSIGMSEETLPFYMIYIPLMLALGYDSLTALAIIFVGSTMGTVASTLNPFATGIAQAIVGLAPGSGADFRVLIWLLFMAVATAFVMRYGARVKASPQSSPVFESDRENRTYFLGLSAEIDEFTRTHKAILLLFTAGMLLVAYGVLAAGWYIEEIAMCFMAMAIIVAIVGRLGSNVACEAFTKGASELIGAALVIGFARGIMVIAQDGYVLDTMLHSASQVMADLPEWLFINVMFFVQLIIGLFVPSSSGAAALTMPIMGPLVDIAEVSQQQNVTAYQLGHGIAILFTPTSGVLMAGLAIARIPWATYFRFIMPLILLLIPASMAVLTLGSFVSY